MTNQTKWLAIIIIVIIIIAGVWYYGGKGSSVPTNLPEVIKIGGSLSLTGQLSDYGQAAQRGMDLALDQINKDGKKVEIVYEDEKSIPEGTVTALQKFISVDHVPVVVGLQGSSGMLAAAPIANSNKVVILSTLSSSDDITKAGDYVFRIRETSGAHGVAMADYVKKNLKLNKVALYYANAANGISYADAFKKEFLKIGGQIIFEDKYMEKSKDYRGALIKLKATNPEAVYLAGLSPDMAQIMTQAKELNIRTVWTSSTGAESPKLFELGKSSVDGLIFTSPAFNPEQSTSTRDFVAAYQTKYNELPNFGAANGYDAVMVVYEVIKKFGYDGEKIKNGLYTIQNYPGVGGTFSFDQNGDVTKPILFKVVQNGQFVPLGQ
ncbi:MAG: ABC transporter substrate-binding protein [Candidatus Paceibacterota bacterium]|jgi:branched-chain amino acid transport system substrate-binding protein